MALEFLNDAYFAAKVGIGTESPTAKLHVNPTTTDEIAIAINGTQNYSAGEFQRIAAGDASSIDRLSIGFGYDNPTDWAIRYSSYGRHEFYTGNDWGNAANTEKMVITSAGNVGIGTGSPDNLLHVQGSNNPRIDLGEDTNNKGWMRWNNADNYIDFTTRVGGTYYADTLVLRNGNVGIGTTGPTGKLTIADTAFTTAYNSIKGLFFDNSNISSGDENFGAGIEFGKLSNGGNLYKKAAIIPVQSGSDSDQMGISFFVSNTVSQASPVIEAMRVDYGGNVGIGTTSPAQPVHLLNGGFAYMRFTSQGYGATGFDIGQHTNGNIYLNNRDNTAMVFMTNNTERMNILAGGTGTFYNAFSIQGDDKSLIVRNAAGTVIGTMGAESSSTPNVGMTTIRNNGTTTIQFNSNGSSYINGGNVGIGTTSPGEKLEVNGVIQIKRIGDHPAIRFVENTTTRGYIGTGDWAVNGGADADLGISSAGTGSLILGTNSGNGRVYIVNGGNVGIGDTSPQGKLEVNNRNTATGAALFIKGGEDDLSPIAGQYTGLAFGYGGGDIYNNGAILWEFTNTAANGKLHFAVNPTAGDGTADLSDSKMTILDSGNVGIGTTSPSSKLHVVGGATNSQHIVRGPYTVGLSGNSLGNATFTAAFNFNGFYNTGYTIEVYALFNHWNSSTANYTYCYRKALLFGYNAAGAAQIDGPGGGVSNSVNVGAWTFSVDNNGVTGYAQRILATKSAGNAAWHGTYWIQIVSSVPLDPLDVS